MPFQIDPGFDPGTILSRQRLPEDPNVLAANALKLKAAQQDQELFPLRKQATELELKNQQIVQQERELDLKETGVWQETMAKYAGDFEKARPELAGKLRPKTLATVDNIYLNHLDKVTDIGKKRADQAKIASELSDSEREAFGGIAADVQASNYNPTAMDAALTLLEATHPQYKKHIDALRQQFGQDPEAIKRLVDGMVTPKARKAAQDVAASKTQQAADEARTKLTNEQIPGEKAKSEMEVAQANALKQMTDADWQTAIDRIEPNKDSALYKRTMAEVQFYRSKGDLKGAADAIKRAGDQLGRTETAVATAKATAPIKIDVASAAGSAAAKAAGDNGGLDIMAEQALAGQFTSRNPQLLASVYGRAAQLAKERGMTSRQVVMEQNAARASQTAYTAVTKNYETLKPFAEMAERNALILEKKAAAVSDLGGSFWNEPLRSAQAKFAGNTNVAAYVAAMQPVVADFARLLNSPTGAGVLSDDARHEMQKSIKEGATLGEIKAALDVFRTDARNRKEEYEKVLQELKGRTVAPDGGGQAGGQQQYKNTARGANGHQIGTNDGGETWYDVQTGQKVQ